MGYCRNCGEEISGTANFCPNCGSPVKGGAESPFSSPVKGGAESPFSGPLRGGGAADDPWTSARPTTEVHRPSRTTVAIAGVFILFALLLTVHFIKAERAADTAGTAAQKSMEEKAETKRESSSESRSESRSGNRSSVDPNLKAFLDSYESFIDEYVTFMKNYQKDSYSSVGIMSDYLKFMMKYAEFVEKLDQYDSEEMTTADAAYYLEVTTRCAQKLLSLYSD